jgi:dTDP-4-amino-4,6-dideoxygalactose transaminase
LAQIAEIAVLADGDARVAHANYCVSVVLADRLASRRVAIMERLAADGVGVSIYYPRAVPLMSYYADKYGVPASAVPHAQRIADQSIALPVGPHLDGDDMARVADALKRAIAEETR